MGIVNTLNSLRCQRTLATFRGLHSAHCFGSVRCPGSLSGPEHRQCRRPEARNSTLSPPKSSLSPQASCTTRSTTGRRWAYCLVPVRGGIGCTRGKRAFEDANESVPFRTKAIVFQRYVECSDIRVVPCIATPAFWRFREVPQNAMTRQEARLCRLPYRAD